MVGATIYKAQGRFYLSAKMKKSLVLSLSRRRVGPQLRFSRAWVNFNRKFSNEKGTLFECQCI